MQFAFFLTNTEQLRDERRVFNLTKEDFNRLNPNTKTCPVFRTRADAELTRKIYERVPVLINEETGSNPWGISFMRMLDMSNDSGLFRTRVELENKGYELVGNRFVRKQPPLSPFVNGELDVYLPLYEAKMIWHFDHRFGSYDGVDSRTSTHIPTPTPEKYADPNYIIQPWYWVAKSEVDAKLKDWGHDWLLGFRNVTNATNERTSIFSLLPLSGVGHSMPLIFLGSVASKFYYACFLKNINSIIFDYVVRQKIGGINLTFGYIEQFPVLPPSAYSESDTLFIVPRVLELVYTAWDIVSFADDVWKDSPESLRSAIEKQWDQSVAEAGFHDSDPPDWAEIDPEGMPFSPAVWNDDRRARIRAELDAYYARLYGLTEEELRYILDPQDVYGKDFPGETFRVLKEKEIRQFGEYRTKRLVLEAWEKLNTSR